jgi:hypothetical protein
MKTLALTLLVAYNLNTPKEIKGTVSDLNSNEKLAGVMVVVNKNDTTYTDLEGKFSIKDVKTIKYLDVVYPSYEKNNYILVQENLDTLVVKPTGVILAKKN